MSQPFEIDTDALGRAEGPFQEMSERLLSLSQDVQARVSSLGPVWGDDKSGKGFVEKYGPSRDGLLEGIQNTADVVKSTADGVRTMSQGYNRTEESAHDASDAVLARSRSVDSLSPLSATGGAVAGAPAGELTPTHATRRRLARMEPTQARSVMNDLEPTQAAQRTEMNRLEPTQATPRMRMDQLEPTQSTPRMRMDQLEPTQSTPRLRDALEPTTAGEPAGRLEPAQYSPGFTEAAYGAAVPGVPAGETTPGQPLEPAYSAAQPGVPAEMDFPAQSTPGIPAGELTPLQPAYSAAQPGIPAEPAHRLEPTIAAEPAHRLEPTIAAEPAHRLEPAVATEPAHRLEPTIAAEPVQRLEPTQSMPARMEVESPRLEPLHRARLDEA